METVFDWLTVAIFAGLIVLFMQRSVNDEQKDSLWQYMIPAIGCAIANYVGNEGNGIVAIAIIVAILAYIYYVLKPFGSGGDSSS